MLTVETTILTVETTILTALAVFSTFMFLLGWAGSQVGRLIARKMNGVLALSGMCALGAWSVALLPLFGISAWTPALCVVLGLTLLESFDQVSSVHQVQATVQAQVATDPARVA